MVLLAKAAMRLYGISFTVLAVIVAETRASGLGPTKAGGCSMPGRPDAAVPSASEGRRRRTAKAGPVSESLRFAAKRFTWFVIRK